MKKPLLLVTALVVAAGAAAWWTRPPGGPPPSPADTLRVDTAGVRAFWRQYRAATRARLDGRLDEAVVAYEAALEFDDRHEDALYYLGNVEMERGANDRAAAAWRRLLAVNPNSARAYHQLGNLSFCRGGADGPDLDRAEGYYRKALALNKEETAPVLRLGEIALFRGDLAAAADHLSDVLATHPRSREAVLFRGYVAWRQGDAAQARRLFARLGADDPAPAPVAGEGDTRHAGALTAEAAGCPLLAPAFDGLAAGDSAEARYRRVDAFLARMRPARSHPSIP